jgi:hypothetical protein
MNKEQTQYYLILQIILHSVQLSRLLDTVTWLAPLGNSREIPPTTFGKSEGNPGGGESPEGNPGESPTIGRLKGESPTIGRLKGLP